MTSVTSSGSRPRLASCSTMPFLILKLPTSTSATRPSPRMRATVLHPSPPWHTILPGNPWMRTSISYPPTFIDSISFRLDVRFADQLAPFLGIRAHDGAELARLVADCGRAHARKPFGDRGVLHDLDHVVVDLRDDRLWNGGGRDQAEPVGELVAGERFAHGRDFGKERRARRAKDRERDQPLVAYIRQRLDQAVAGERYPPAEEILEARG